MADVQITKIIVLRGKSAELPHDLDPAELAFSTDEGRLFVGSDPSSGQPQHGRATFPYRNVEILTENSDALFTKMHGDRMKEGGGADYYTARLDPSSSWRAVRVYRDGDLHDYRFNDIAAVTAFIDYAVVAMDGRPFRMGAMQLTHYEDFEGAPQLADQSSVRRDTLLTAPSNYDPAQAMGSVVFRFNKAGPINAPYLTFQYKNLSDDVLNLRFKVSRPEAVFYESGQLNIYTDPPFNT